MTGQWWKGQDERPAGFPAGKPAARLKCVLTLGEDFEIPTPEETGLVQERVRRWLDDDRQPVLILPAGSTLTVCRIDAAGVETVEVRHGAPPTVAVPQGIASWTVCGGIDPESQNWAGVE